MRQRGKGPVPAALGKSRALRVRRRRQGGRLRVSETDSFIDEVTEEVRRDRLFAVMRRYGWIGIVLVFAIVGGAAYNEWRKASLRAEAEGFGDAVLAAIQAEDRAAALAAVPATGDRAGLRDLLLAAVSQDAGERDRALAALQAVAADPALPPLYRDLARLKWVMLAGAGMAPADRDAALSALAVPGAPFRALALEQQALAHLAGGRTEEAIAALQALSQDATASPGLQRRAAQLIVALGGDVAPGDG